MTFAKALVAALLALGLVATAQSTPSIDRKQPKLAEASVSPDYVSIEGVWEPANPTEKNRFLLFGVDRIECWRTGGRVLLGTDSFCVTAEAIQKTETIDVDINWWKVVEWNEAEIIMVDDSPFCNISQTTIDLISKTATHLDLSKPNAKHGCIFPYKETYYLRDGVDYHYAHLADKPK